ncbi:MAG TPA: glycosyltransferase [Candidatus Moranbacteria bacterium]|nr:glycosyltransferase [Candidatus Moranbacteria bacterium]
MKEQIDTEPEISFVVPLHNEEGNVRELHRQIVAAGKDLGKSFEVIFVDDGSRDKTVENLRDLSPLKLIIFRRNFGQTAAMDAGIKAARGRVIITLDGDLQNDPADSELLLRKMEEGFDVVSGWRHKRQDDLMKKFFSRGANLLRKILLSDSIHDSGCSLKAYRRECFEGVDLYGEMHRFIPAVLEMDGWRVGEVKISHRPRRSGVTKYNWKRAVKGFVDMVSIWFFRHYSARPLHFFGGAGILLGLLGGGILLWMLVEKVFFGAAIADRLWPLVGVFLTLAGIQFFIFGLLADMILKNNFKLRGRMNYSIKEVREN